MTPERLAQIQKNHAEAQAEIDKADMLPAIVEVFQEDRASLLADVERLRDGLIKEHSIGHRLMGEFCPVCLASPKS